MNNQTKQSKVSQTAFSSSLSAEQKRNVGIIKQVPKSPRHRNSKIIAEEVASFLARRAIHTFGLAGLLQRNGLSSPLNRGTVYLCRNARKHLLGVALIGYFTLFETLSEDVIEAFALLARAQHTVRRVIGEADKVDIFWRHYSVQQALSSKSFQLFHLNQPIFHEEPVSLRKATIADLDMVARAHAQMFLEERGENPLESEPAAFRERCAKRISQGQTLVAAKGNEIRFKAEVMAETPQVTYLEGIWVAPGARRQGYGSQCFAYLSQIYLARSAALCILADKDNTAALSFYEKAGCQTAGDYKGIFI